MLTEHWKLTPMSLSDDKTIRLMTNDHRLTTLLKNMVIKSACIYTSHMLNFNSMIALLVVTSDEPFGELLRKNLEGTGRFNVLVTGDARAAIEYVLEWSCPLAFLDSTSDGQKVVETGALLRQANPEIRFVLVSEPGWQPALAELNPIKYLAKPFNLPDLMEMMDDLFGKLHQTPTFTAPQPEADFPWLVDVTRAAQHLTRLTLETSAQAALITRNDELWSYAGQLPQDAARELADAVARYWDSQKERDLVRFIRLNSTDAEHMLFATRLTASMVLALIFDNETPFSTIRSQAAQLVRALWVLPSENAAGMTGLDDEEDEAPQTSISDILSDIPTPNPQVSPPVHEALEARPPWKEPNPAIPFSFGRSLRFIRDIASSRETAEAPRNHLFETRATDEASTDLEKTARIPTVSRDAYPDRSAADPVFSATHPSPTIQNTRRILFEPISPAVYNLDYACMLIPRMPYHYLAGDLSDQLSEWIPQLCVAFGWRLEYIAIRPEYLLWIANGPPTTAPGNLMRMLRVHSSQRIFEEFPRFLKDNPSGDFWAPGFLLMSGSQPPPASSIKDFITRVRQSQGFAQ